MRAHDDAVAQVLDLVGQAGHIVTWAVNARAAPAPEVATRNIEDLMKLARNSKGLATQGPPEAAQAAIMVYTDIVGKVVATFVALGLGTVPPQMRDSDAAEAVGQLEVAESLAKRTKDIERTHEDLTRQHTTLGQEVQQLDAKLKSSNLDKRTRKALSQKREQRARQMESAGRHMGDLEAERERNLLMVMNAFARVHKLAKTVFKGHIYRHLVSSMGGVQEHLHMRTVLQYDGELGIGPLPPLTGHALLKKTNVDAGQPDTAPPEFVSNVELDTSWSYTVPVVGLDYARLAEGQRLAVPAPTKGQTTFGVGSLSPRGIGGVGVGSSSGRSSGGNTSPAMTVASLQRAQRETAALVGDGLAFDVAPMPPHGPPVLIKHDDNWGCQRDPPPFLPKSRSPVHDDAAAGGGWTPGRSAREQRRIDSERFLAKVKQSSSPSNRGKSNARPEQSKGGFAPSRRFRSPQKQRHTRYGLLCMFCYVGASLVLTARTRCIRRRANSGQGEGPRRGVVQSGVVSPGSRALPPLLD